TLAPGVLESNEPTPTPQTAPVSAPETAPATATPVSAPAAAAPVSAPVSAPAAAACGRFVVQVGAVSDQTRAQQYQQRLSLQFSVPGRVIQNGAVWRIQLGPFASKA
ncbi:SPOR domain-containing protein, partial [Salmonella enterica]|uniref:SPOR domain-containing protein n=1 Tax=Salmonella enterica TaxID=28901 RepID=UPI0020C2577A